MGATDFDRRSASARFGGQLIFPDDAGYDSACRVWSKAIDRRPAVIARCRGTEDVVAALRLKRVWDSDNVFRLNQNIPPAPATA
jgi:Berberine and berberine like